MRATRPVTASTLLAAGVAVVVVATAAPAVARGTLPAPVAYTDGGPQRDADATASVAGYVAGLDGTARRVASGTFTVPSATCPRDSTPLFVSLGLYGDAVGPSTEFDYASADLTITCTAGVPFYEASVSTNPERQSGAVSPGDVLEVKISTAARTSVVTLTDQTSGGVFRVEGSGLEPTSLQASVQGGFDGEKFPRFGTVRFVGVRASGNTLATYSPTSFDQVSPAGKLLLQTSPLTSGQTFRVTYRAQP